jgi:hypothetical protein
MQLTLPGLLPFRLVAANCSLLAAPLLYQQLCELFAAADRSSHVEGEADVVLEQDLRSSGHTAELLLKQGAWILPGLQVDVHTWFDDRGTPASSS